MTGKLVFLDIDGTLTEPGSNVPPASALSAIREAQERGHRVFLCTGRNPAMLAPLLQYGFDGYIGSAGGYITVGGQVIYDKPMDNEDAQLGLRLLHGEGVFCTVEARDGTWGDEDLGDFLAGSSGGNSEIERWRRALAEDLHILPMSQYDGRPIYKIVIMCIHPEQLQPAREALEDRYAFCIQEITDPSHHCLNGELINRAFDKGRGVERICEYLGVPVSDTVGFGDSMNDLEMIRTVGVSVCMANGSEQLKKEADLVCPPVTENGLAEGFRMLGLTGN